MSGKNKLQVESFIKYKTKHNLKINIVKPKIRVIQENRASNVSILLENHHQTNCSKSIFKLAGHDDVIKCNAIHNHMQNHDIRSKE